MISGLELLNKLLIKFNYSSNGWFKVELHLDVHCSELIGHVPQHIGQSDLSAVVVVTDSAVDFFIN